MRIENYGSIHLNVNKADLNTSGTDFATSIQSTYTRDAVGKGLTSITLGGKTESDRRTITAHRNSDEVTKLKNTTLGTGITATELAGAADEVSNLLERFKTASDDDFDELRMENALPQVYAIGGRGNDHPEAPWN